jgi:hypothetical protein
MYLCDLPTTLLKDEYDPILMDNTKVSCLLYADDLVIISQSQSGLQNSLNYLDTYCKKWQLKINFNKSKVIIFHKRKISVQFNIDNKAIDVVNEYTYLGITYHKDGTFHRAIKELAFKALVKTIFSNHCTPKVGMHMFDSMIKPISLYGCETWGAYLKEWKKDNFQSCIFGNTSYPFEKLHVKCCKSLLGVTNKASTIAAMSELGRFPLMLNIIQAIIRFICNTARKNSNSLVYKAMMCQIKYKLPYITTYNRITKWTEISNVPYNLNGKAIKSVNSDIGAKLKKWYIDQIFQKTKCESLTESGKKLRTYFKLKHTFSREKYLDINNYKYRKYVTKIRISNHNLPIERGRYNNIDINDRTCRMCTNSHIGDEFHLLMACDHNELNILRNDFFEDIFKILPPIQDFSNELKFVYIFSMMDQSILTATAKYITKCLDVFGKHTITCNTI